MRIQAADLAVTLSDSDDAPGRPLVILCHGFGAPGDDLVSLADVPVWPRVRYAFPMAPLVLEPGYGDDGPRAWWPLEPRDFELLGSGAALPRPAGLTAATQLLAASVRALVTRFRPSKLVLGGFSQGAMVATDTALHALGDLPELAGLLLMSGTLLDADWAAAASARRPGALSVFVSHGEDDPLLPFDRAEALRDLFGKAGMVVEWSPFVGGHGIPPTVLARAGRFLARTLLGD